MALDWAKRMRLMIIAGIVAVLLLIVGATVFAFVYKVPSCTDRTQNQGEAGVDCGGPCTYLCTAQVKEPNVQFARALTLANGRTDVVAKIQNLNKGAEAKAAPYVLELYAADATLLARVPGFIDVPAGEMVPLFVRSAAGGSNVARAFVDFDPEKIMWQKAEQVDVPLRISGSNLIEGPSPKVSGFLHNDGYDALYDVKAIAIVYDGEGTAIAASETLVPSIRAQSSVPVTFTWNEPFQTSPARFEILPSLPLP
jgi:hypothetical protein